MSTLFERHGNTYRVTSNGHTALAVPLGGGMYDLGGFVGGDVGHWTGGPVKAGSRSYTEKQMDYVVEIVSTVASAVNDESPRLAQIATLMCAIVESAGIWMYANSNVPESLTIPHDRVGSDGLSVGLYQQQPIYGWGTVAECMDVAASTRSFLGGPDGPRAGASPLGLLDLDPSYRERATLGAAVQAVQVSAFPDRYDAERVNAEALLDLVLD